MVRERESKTFESNQISVDRTAVCVPNFVRVCVISNHASTLDYAVP